MTYELHSTPSNCFRDEPGHFDVVETIAVNFQGYPKRFGLGGWTKDGEGRIETGGEKFKGPHLFAFGLCTVIDNHGGTAAERAKRLEQKLEVDVQIGDILLIDGQEYEVARHVWSREHLEMRPLFRVKDREEAEKLTPVIHGKVILESGETLRWEVKWLKAGMKLVLKKEEKK